MNHQPNQTIPARWKRVIALHLVFTWVLAYHYFNLMDTMWRKRERGSDLGLLDMTWGQDWMAWTWGIGLLITLFTMYTFSQDSKSAHEPDESEESEDPPSA